MNNLRSHFLVVIFYVGFFVACSVTPENLVEVHTSEIISPSDEYIGNGVEWSAYPHADSDRAEWGLLMTDEKWGKVFERLDYMRPQIVRVLDQANWRYLEGFDANGEPILNFENQEMQALYKLLDYCEANNITVILGEWGEPYEVHETHLEMQYVFSGTNDPRWHSIITEHLDYLLNTKNYTVIKYYNLVNEPNGYWSSVDGDWDEWKEGINMLDESLKDHGLKDRISIIGPDATPFNNDSSKYTGYEWATESVKQLSDVFTAYDIHDYPMKDFVRSGDFGRHYSKLVSFADSLSRKPFIFGEIGFEKWIPENLARIEKDPNASEDSQLSVYDFDYGVDMADVVIQTLNSGFDATIAWGLDDAMHTNGDTGDRTQLKKWGMWNILGTELTGDPSEEDIRPWFYTWSLMSRYFPTEMNIVEVDRIPFPNVRMTAAISDEDNFSMAFVNNSDTAAVFPVDIQKLPDSAKLKKYVYTEFDRPVDSKGFPIPSEEMVSLESISWFNSTKRIDIEIPPRSFLLYTSLNY